MEEYLQGLLAEASRDLLDVETLEDLKQIKGSMLVIEYMLDIPARLETIAREKKEEEEQRNGD